jgi:hypothetical protein
VNCFKVERGERMGKEMMILWAHKREDKGSRRKRDGDKDRKGTEKWIKGAREILR